MAQALRAIAAASARPNLARVAAYVVFGGPIAAGLALTLAPAFGYLPALGGDAFSLAPWRALLAEAGLAGSLRLTITVGFASTALALALAFGLMATLGERVRSRGFEYALAPLLAAPHVAIAIGLAFLIAPSGWLVRLVSPWATGLTSPPDIATVNDAYGLALTLGRVLKETPFLLIVALGALNQIPVAAQMRVARSLGYRPAAAWLKIVAPQLYAQIRLPVYAALAYALSVVDTALVLAPSHPAPLSVVGLRLFMAPDLNLVFPGAAAATLQLAIVVAALGIWRLGEIGVARLGRARVATGERGASTQIAAVILGGAALAALALAFAAIAALALWSFAWRWPFPDALPESWSLEVWRRNGAELLRPLGDTLALAAVSSALALALALCWLEGDDRAGRAPRSAAIYVPLLLPQLAFLFGAQTFFAALRLDGSFAAVAWAHALFVFPYVMLALSDPWRALDPRYARAAGALGASPGRTFLFVKLPILFRPIAIAFAIGVSVSVAQYLATLFAGGGRVPTLTTEALALASGGDRRVAAIAGFLQALLPMVVYLAALMAPRLVYAGRRRTLSP
ncbi:MAG: ABC transporter permease [Roseiarcus sp.]|jgi:putative thiamine transport system permease protein